MLVGYDGGATGPLAPVSMSSGLLGGALVLARNPKADAPRIEITITDGDATRADGLARIAGGNAMAPMLPLFEALARAGDGVSLFAGRGRTLKVGIAHG